MIKTLMLMFIPARAWDGIVSAQRSLLFVLCCYLIPLLALTSAGEGYGLVHWGKWQGEVTHLRRFSVREAVLFEAAQIFLSVVVVFLNAGLVKSVGGTFHGRHTFTQTFTAVAYSLGPLFLFRLLNASSDIYPWISWAIGILLSLGVLYHGVPKAILPDPAHGFGLFMSASLLLLLTTGLLEVLTYCFLQGRFRFLQALSSNAAVGLPF